MLSLMYSDGLGVEQDMRQARLLSEAAVKNGLKGGIAETNLGWWYLTGESGHPKDLQLAHEWNRRVPRRAMRMPAPIWRSSMPPDWVATAT